MQTGTSRALLSLGVRWGWSCHSLWPGEPRPPHLPCTCCLRAGSRTALGPPPAQLSMRERGGSPWVASRRSLRPHGVLSSRQSRSWRRDGGAAWTAVGLSGWWLCPAAVGRQQQWRMLVAGPDRPAPCSAGALGPSNITGLYKCQGRWRCGMESGWEQETCVFSSLSLGAEAPKPPPLSWETSHPLRPPWSSWKDPHSQTRRCGGLAGLGSTGGGRV